VTTNQLKAIEILDGVREQLGPWEAQFIKTLADGPKDYLLSKRQREVLQNIVDRYDLSIDCKGGEFWTQKG